MKFRYNTTGFMHKDDFNALMSACKTIGDCIFYPPSSGMTENGVDYLPVDILEDPKDIALSLQILNSYFQPIMAKDKS